MYISEWLILTIKDWNQFPDLISDIIKSRL